MIFLSDKPKADKKVKSGFMPAIEVGTKIIFGSYYQSNSKDKEEIEWKVLEIKDGKALIISDKTLDCQQYNTTRTDVSWETCTLRKWMNGTFYEAAFNASEQKQIQSTKVTADTNPEYSTNPGNDTTDKVFLLSIDEVNKYFDSDKDRMCVPTKYAINNGAYTDRDYETCWWWLRSPGDYGHYAANVYAGGDVSSSGDYVYDDDACVRPVLWIEI